MRRFLETKGASLQHTGQERIPAFRRWFAGLGMPTLGLRVYARIDDRAALLVALQHRDPVHWPDRRSLDFIEVQSYSN
jgi:hypothetical protein